MPSRRPPASRLPAVALAALLLAACDKPGSTPPPPPANPDLASPRDLSPPILDGGAVGVAVGRTHFRVTFADEFRGKTGAPDDSYCFDQLKPQCHVWAGTSHDCDLADVGGAGFFPPTKANLVAAIKLIDPNHDFAALSEAQVKDLYGQIITPRLAHLNKCNWTLYEMVNWMATDYQGHWSARFDATQVEVDPAGKGYLKLSASYAPVEYDCVYGGSGGHPNCQVHAFAAGEVVQGVNYRVDPDPRWPGVYYPPVGGGCPHGGQFTGVNCQVIGFAPHFLEESGVAYGVDADPQWPGVYYANETYRCKENIDYSPNLAFRNLTCPILDGGLMSYAFTNRPYVDPNGNARPRGAMQYQGRFEAKGRVPKGVGAFPATWLMPKEGGWPYKGGEIDVMEARYNADEIYQTYHHGKCYLAANGQPIAADDSADCTRKGGVSTHLSKGYTVKQRATDEFWKRDHLFAVEWTDHRFVYSVNNVVVGSIDLGTIGTIDNGAPAALAAFESTNFPTSPFYWILNHSTYVPPAQQAGFARQTFHIDYVRNYVACGADNAEYCPCGGRFQEGVGCALGGQALSCPPGMAAPVVANGVYASPCQPSVRTCVNGGSPAGARCLVYSFPAGVLRAGVSYWADADPRWPGVYYAKVNGGCPYGGGGTVNCGLQALPADLLEQGVSHVVDAAANPPGVYYTPDFP